MILKFYPEALKCAKTICSGVIQCKANWTMTKCCSLSCAKLGIPQSATHVARRVASTDQIAKELRKSTNLLKKTGGRYSNVSQLPATRRKMSASGRARPHPRTAEHQRSIIESKIRNGTLKHTKRTRRKIGATMRLVLNHPSFDKSRLMTKNPKSIGRNHRCSTVNGLHCRSSYEARFVTACFAHGILVRSAECLEFAVRYRHDGQSRTYYPDFYLPGRGYVIEIKPATMLKLSARKLRAGRRRHGDKYRVLTEVALQKFEETGRVYEHLCA